MIKKLKISDFTTVITGGTPSTGKKEFWDNGDIPWLNSGELNNDRIFSSKNYITKLGLSSSSTRMMPADSVLIALTGTTTGVTSILKIEACANQSVTGILPSDKHNTEYLYYYISSIRSTILKDAYGGAQKHISQGYVKDLEIPLPPLSIQKAIAEKLDKADALRKKDKELLAQYDDLAQAIFIDMFGDPVKNEKGWNKPCFGEIFESRLGKMLDKANQHSGIDYYYLGNSNVQWFNFNMEHLNMMKFQNNELEKFTLRKGDLLICEGGEVGRCSVWNLDEGKIFFQKALHRARLKNSLESVEFYAKQMWFLANYGGLKDFVTSATIAHLTGEKLKLVPIIQPPILLQNQFAEKIQNIEAQKAIVKQQAQQSEDLFQALLQESFNFNKTQHEKPQTALSGA